MSGRFDLLGKWREKISPSSAFFPSALRLVFDEPMVLFQLLEAYLRKDDSPNACVSVIRRTIQYSRVQSVWEWESKGFLQGFYLLQKRNLTGYALTAFGIQLFLLFLMLFSSISFYSFFIRRWLPLVFLVLIVGVNAVIALSGRWLYCLKFLSDLEQSGYGQTPLPSVLEEMKTRGAENVWMVLGSAFIYAIILCPIIIFITFRISLFLLRLFS